MLAVVGAWRSSVRQAGTMLRARVLHRHPKPSTLNPQLFQCSLAWNLLAEAVAVAVAAVGGPQEEARLVLQVV